MEYKLSKLSLQDLVSIEKCISAVCKKYENAAEMNRYLQSDAAFKKAANSLTYFNNKRDAVLEEMEKRINEIV